MELNTNMDMWSEHVERDNTNHIMQISASLLSIPVLDQFKNETGLSVSWNLRRIEATDVIYIL